MIESDMVLSKDNPEIKDKKGNVIASLDVNTGVLSISEDYPTGMPFPFVEVNMLEDLNEVR